MKVKTIIEKKDNVTQKFDYAADDKLLFNDINKILGLFPQNNDVNPVVAYGIKMKNHYLVQNSLSCTTEIKNYYDALMNSTTKEDYLNVLNTIIKAYLNKKKNPITRIIDINEALREHPDVLVAYMSLAVAKQYYMYKFDNMNDEKIEQLESLKLRGANTQELLEVAHESIPGNNPFSFLAKEVFANCIDEKFYLLKNSCSNDKHLCMSCENATVSKCKKIADQYKLHINDYDFVTKGYQVLDEHGRVDKFVVNKCENYSKDKPRSYTKEQLLLFEQYKETLLLRYYEADDITDLTIKQLYNVGISMKELDIKDRVRR